MKRFILTVITGTLLFAGAETVYDSNFKDDFTQIVKVCIPVLATLASKSSSKGEKKP